MVLMPSVVGLFVLQFDGCCGCTFDVIFCDDSLIWSQQVPYLILCHVGLFAIFPVIGMMKILC